MEDSWKLRHRGSLADSAGKSPPPPLDSRTRLLRSQLRRQKILKQIKMDRRLERKEKELRREDRFQPDIQSNNFLPPLIVNSATSPRNTKSALVDLMMMKSLEVSQMMSHRMALSLQGTADDGGQSQTSRTHERDKLLLALIIKAVKIGDKQAASDGRRQLVHPPYYLPVLPRISDILNPDSTTRISDQKANFRIPVERKPVLEETTSLPASMTSKWKARAPAKPDPSPVEIFYPARNSNVQHRRKVLKRFRLAAYCALFASIMRRKEGRRLMYDLHDPAIDADVITGIRIKECVQALHKIYLNPERKMLRILRQMYDPNLDLGSVLTESSSKEQRHRTTETLASFIEHVAYEMAFEPTPTGSLGTENRLHLRHLLQPNQSFPATYFWSIEKDLLGIDDHNRTKETIDANDKFIILIGLCLGRALFATVLRQPHQFGLTHSGITEALSTKVRLILTLFAYLIRRLYAPRNGNPVTAAFPEDLNKKLFTDEAMEGLLKKLQASFDYAEKLLRDWGENYVRRLNRA